MSKKVKLKKVYVEDDNGSLIKHKVKYGIMMGANEKEGMKMAVIGESTFEEMNDLVMSGIRHLYESAVEVLGEEQREAIYERSVQMFSLLMDEFYPEGKDKKNGSILTDEDIKEAEDKKIESLYKQKKD